MEKRIWISRLMWQYHSHSWALRVRLVFRDPYQRLSFCSSFLLFTVPWPADFLSGVWERVEVVYLVQHEFCQNCHLQKDLWNKSQKAILFVYFAMTISQWNNSLTYTNQSLVSQMGNGGRKGRGIGKYYISWSLIINSATFTTTQKLVFSPHVTDKEMRCRVEELSVAQGH